MRHIASQTDRATVLCECARACEYCGTRGPLRRSRQPRARVCFFYGYVRGGGLMGIMERQGVGLGVLVGAGGFLVKFLKKKKTGAKLK